MRNLAERLDDDAARAMFTVPPLVSALVQRGWIGSKTGQGFYKKSGDEILTLDPTGDGLPAAAARASGFDRCGAEHGTVSGPDPVPVPRAGSEPDNSCAIRSGSCSSTPRE